MRKIISIIVQNEHGALSRITSLFAGRGYNIESLTVAAIPKTDDSRITIITHGDKKVIEQIVKQLNKLIPVYKVMDSDELIEKEMALIKISLKEDFSGLEMLVKGYNGSVANANEDYIIVMVAAETNRITNFIKAVQKYNPLEIVRSGSVAMELK